MVSPFASVKVTDDELFDQEAYGQTESPTPTMQCTPGWPIPFLQPLGGGCSASAEHKISSEICVQVI